MPLRDVAHRVGITERAVLRIVADLEEGVTSRARGESGGIATKCTRTAP